MALIEVNTGTGWYALPTPKPGGYYPSYTHLENSYRDARGFLHRDIIRRNTAKLECSWNALTKEQIMTLQSLYTFDSFLIRYTDYNGSRVEKKVYAGVLKGNTESLIHDTLAPNITTDVSMNFIEY